MDGLRDDVGGIRSELRTERKERFAVADRVFALEQKVG